MTDALTSKEHRQDGRTEVPSDLFTSVWLTTPTLGEGPVPPVSPSWKCPQTQSKAYAIADSRFHSLTTEINYHEDAYWHGPTLSGRWHQEGLLSHRGWVRHGCCTLQCSRSSWDSYCKRFCVCPRD